MDDNASRAWDDDSHDMAADLEQSINEMLTGQGKPVPAPPMVAAHTETGLSSPIPPNVERPHESRKPWPVGLAIFSKGALKDAL